MKKICLALALPVALCACNTPTIHSALGTARDIGRVTTSDNGSTWEDADDTPPACARLKAAPRATRP